MRKAHLTVAGSIIVLDVIIGPGIFLKFKCINLHVLINLKSHSMLQFMAFFILT
jgi:hypothetical protein